MRKIWTMTRAEDANEFSSENEEKYNSRTFRHDTYELERAGKPHTKWFWRRFKENFISCRMIYWNLKVNLLSPQPSEDVDFSSCWSLMVLRDVRRVCDAVCQSQHMTISHFCTQYSSGWNWIDFRFTVGLVRGRKAAMAQSTQLKIHQERLRVQSKIYDYFSNCCVWAVWKVQVKGGNAQLSQHCVNFGTHSTKSPFVKVLSGSTDAKRLWQCSK